MSVPQELKDAFNNYDGDVVLYLGSVNREGYSVLSATLENKSEKANKVCLILATTGGDPNAGYRIARALNHHYGSVEILVPDVCKSAGTLICIGASKLIFGDRGELGPLDIQLSKPDELFENQSGLNIIQAISVLEGQVMSSFQQYLLHIKGDLGLSTKLAAQMATELTQGLVSPISTKIDPMTLGEHQRAMQIGMEYGTRLDEMTKSLKEGALEKLISNYPSHGFVIDRKEAKSLFKSVTSPDNTTEKLYDWSRTVVETMGVVSYNNPIVIDLGKLIQNGEGND